MIQYWLYSDIFVLETLSETCSLMLAILSQFNQNDSKLLSQCFNMQSSHHHITSLLFKFTLFYSSQCISQTTDCSLDFTVYTYIIFYLFFILLQLSSALFSSLWLSLTLLNSSLFLFILFQHSSFHTANLTASYSASSLQCNDNIAATLSNLYGKMTLLRKWS